MKKHVFIFLFLFSEVARAGAGAGGNPGGWAGNPLDYFVHYEVEVIKAADGTCNRKFSNWKNQKIVVHMSMCLKGQPALLTKAVN